jgi:hypothetical protein
VKPADWLNSRVADDPRLSKSQRDALAKAAGADEEAGVIGLDNKMRPVVRARLSGPGRQADYALRRNGNPARVTMPMAEAWSERPSGSDRKQRR